MDDATTTLAQVRDWMRQFVADRQWEVFHTPKNLSMSLAIEVAELMEHFQWLENSASKEVVADPVKLAAIGEELADVLSYTLALSNALNLDLAQTLHAKMKKNAIKYPAGK